MPHTPLMSEAQTSTGPQTWDDFVALFVALEEDDPRELIDGELVEVEVPTNRNRRRPSDPLKETKHAGHRPNPMAPSTLCLSACAS
jgi:hypothetical protein